MNVLLRRICASLLLLVSFAPASPCHALSRLFTFDTPPDNAVVTINGVGGPGYPAQLPNTQTAVETTSGFAFRNEVNNPVFLDSQAPAIANASNLSGTFAWGNAFGNGPTDPAFFEIDLTGATAGVPVRVEYDTAVASTFSDLTALVFDTDGDSRTYVTPTTPFSFGGGSDNGSQVHVVLTPTGNIDNIARIQFSFGEGDGSSTLEFGFDNLLIDTGQSADFGGDGMIDINDLVTWQGQYGTGTGADADRDGDSDGSDYLIWQLERSSTSLTALTVPEPSTWLMSLVAAFVPAACRRQFR